MQADRWCIWKNHHVRDMHVVNKEITAGFCVGCSAEIQRAIIAANIRAELPHRFPVAAQEEDLKLADFWHGMEANN